MKKRVTLLCLILAVCFMFCACESGLQYDYSDGDDTGELITAENEKVSDDKIGITVVTPNNKDENKIKVHKTEFLFEDFSFKYEKARFNNFAYVSETDTTPQYPEKIALPQYNLEALREIMLKAYTERYGEIKEDGSVYIAQPRFTTRNFTGKLVVTYTIYLQPSTDERGIGCYKDAKRIVMTCDLYTYVTE